ncbi:hypothetical protein [Paraburkholderia sp. CNPSo 3281]|uniref:hypothetical protein n=1 Tax=Paraburkholderia sp. CNPSo 3281 TaxID=2940933 RepID=UPI0020B6A810|nr:hypothetical protein [Paraburkholderia sp. CNPSo 3281]MCP3721385.1 hypothetical protein [Paraburkholderia sp. CNPSo 3281]
MATTGRFEFFKDESLDRLAEIANVAQFVSFAPGAEAQQRYARVRGFAPNHRFASLEESLSILLAASSEDSLNVRSFRPNALKSNEFIYGLKSVEKAAAAVRRLTSADFHVIVNETIDVNDGGVSGVSEGGIIEFSPDDTPRCVEKPGTASLPASLGRSALERVYGVSLDLSCELESRFEFSVHPSRRGWKGTHVLGWELESTSGDSLSARLEWPNNFSRLIGDKAFGLLMAAEAGLPVPRTTVISRRIAPFTFGLETGDSETWIRTCPKEQVPGRFTTKKGWTDPFALLQAEDPSGTQISSILAQSSVTSYCSGAAIVDSQGELVIEGRMGEGEVLMKGEALPEAIPKMVLDDIYALYERCKTVFGPVRFEWVHDGERPWIVQLHRGATASRAEVIVPGEANVWIEFDVSEGLSALRVKLEHMGKLEGVRLHGRVGLTSHIADVVRKAGRPARIVAAA